MPLASMVRGIRLRQMFLFNQMLEQRDGGHAIGHRDALSTAAEKLSTAVLSNSPNGQVTRQLHNRDDPSWFSNPPTGARAVRNLGNPSLGFGILERPVHCVIGNEPQRQVPVQRSELQFGEKFRSLGHARYIKRRDEARAIGAIQAVDENRRLDLRQDGKQLFHLRGRQLTLRGELIVDKLNPVFSGRRALNPVPVLVWVGAAEIDDRLDPIACMPIGDLLGRGLRGTVELAANNRMEVAVCKRRRQKGQSRRPRAIKL